MKKITILFMVLGTLLISGCSGSTVDTVKKETLDQVENLSNQNNKYVLMVKDGHPTNYPNSTYGKSFGDFFGSPTWKYFKAEDGRDVVEFTGDCTYQEVQVKARQQFILDSEGGTFEAGALSFNEVPQSELITGVLLSKVFEEATPKMIEPSEKAETKKITPASESTQTPSKTDTKSQDNQSEEFIYKNYSNARYQFSIMYPSNLTKKQLSENGDGIILLSEDEKVKLTVYGGYNISSDTVQSLYAEAVKQNSNASYKKQSANWFVISYAEGDKIIYKKTIVEQDSIYNFIFEYPIKEKEVYAKVVEKLNESFKSLSSNE